MFKRVSNIVIISIWTIASLLWMISMFSILEITNGMIRNICACMTIAGVIYVILNFIPFRKPKNYIGIVTVVSVIITGVLSEIYNWKEDWQTQTVLYKNGHFSSKTIEFQTQKNGESKYNCRIVEITKLTDYLKIVQHTDTAEVHLPWIKVSKNTSEQS